MPILYRGNAAEFELLQATLAGAGVGVWEYDLKTAVAKADKRTATMFGLTDEERLAAPIESFLRAIHPDDLAAVETEFAPPDPFDVTYRLVRDDAELWVRSVGHWGERDGSAIVLGITIDITRERHRQNRLELLAHEMRHRVGNTFAILSGLVGFEAEEATSAADLADRLRDKLVTLSRAQSLSFQGSHIEPETNVKGLIQTVVKPFRSTAHGRFDMEGPEVTLDSETTVTLSMVLYEWLTNALKYGALSVPTGEISVNWTVDAGMLSMTWEERNCPPRNDATASIGGGFGEKMQRAALEQMGGKVEYQWRDDGVVIRLQIPTNTAETH